MDDAVSLREFFERILAEHNKALELQQTEYARRLDELNHAHQRAEAIAHNYLTIDKYETGRTSDAQALKLALERVDEKLAAADNWRAKATGVGLVLVLVAGVIGAAIMRALGG